MQWHKGGCPLHPAGNFCLRGREYLVPYPREEPCQPGGSTQTCEGGLGLGRRLEFRGCHYCQIQPISGLYPPSSLPPSPPPLLFHPSLYPGNPLCPHPGASGCSQLSTMWTLDAYCSGQAESSGTLCLQQQESVTLLEC